MQTRLSSLLLSVGYKTEQLLFSQTLAQSKKMVEEHPISFCLVDLGLPDGNGQDFIEYLRNQDIGIPILVISAWSTQDAILGAIQSGATGYLLKERDDFEIILSIRSILRGGAPIDPFIAQQILSKIIKPNQPRVSLQHSNHILSSRELEILELVAQGLSNKAIANEVNLSRYTVESHIKHIYRKLAVCNRTKAVDTARSLGIL
ncbi:LuxR C-terminal-related transcriptional regulator [Acinetobacter qingfengensis]